MPLLKIIYYIFVNIFSVPPNFQMRIMPTPIFDFLPQFKQHHLVLLSKSDGVYSIDFTPVEDRRRIKTSFKMFLGKNVKGEIRIRYVKGSTLWEEDKIITAICEKPFSENESRALTNTIHNSIKDKQIKNFVDNLIEWKKDKNQTMNLYIRNCQHFSRYAEKILPCDIEKL